MVTAQSDSNLNDLDIPRGMGPNAARPVTVGVGPSRTDWGQGSQMHGGMTACC